MAWLSSRGTWHTIRDHVQRWWAVRTCSNFPFRNASNQAQNHQVEGSFVTDFILFATNAWGFSLMDGTFAVIGFYLRQVVHQDHQKATQWKDESLKTEAEGSKPLILWRLPPFFCSCCFARMIHSNIPIRNVVLSLCLFVFLFVCVWVNKVDLFTILSNMDNFDKTWHFGGQPGPSTEWFSQQVHARPGLHWPPWSRPKKCPKFTLIINASTAGKGRGWWH